ncbi:hypothetical protein LEMLEM_LOCUS24511, partial [Lemmus lemmus]
FECPSVSARTPRNPKPRSFKSGTHPQQDLNTRSWNNISKGHASSLHRHIQIAGIFLLPASAFSSSGAEREDDGEGARRLQGRWASPRRAEPAVGTCLLPRAR